jgi:dihydroorotate dehydrogenase electron transfer subunit
MVLPEPVPSFFNLRRAFSIYAKTDKELLVAIKKTGRITALLEKMQPGSQISYLGPLGNHFTLDSSRAAHMVLAAGGIGIAPLHFLAHHFFKNNIAFTLLYGAATSREIIELPGIQGALSQVLYATEDGSIGYKGKVTDLLADFLAGTTGACNIFACGPIAMLNAVSNRFRNPAMHIEISVETIMGCGFGACRGCAIPTGINKYKMACTDGPVFNINEILWEQWL